MKPNITVEYKTRKDYCDCCDQKLPNAKVSEIKEFYFDKDSLMNYGDWNEFAEYEEELDEIVEQYVYETIGFYAASSNDTVFVEKSQLAKVKQSILAELSK